jgi:pyruvyltransferase
MERTLETMIGVMIPTGPIYGAQTANVSGESRGKPFGLGVGFWFLTQKNFVSQGKLSLGLYRLSCVRIPTIKGNFYMLSRLFKRPSIKAYWWSEAKNLGDQLTPLLLERFADMKVEWGSVSHSSVVSVGSILEHIPPLWDGYILGAGRLKENSSLHLRGMNSGVTAKILALRGPLTAKALPGNYALGDPGLLADELVGPQEKQWDLGIIPHFSDLELVPRFKALIPTKHSIRVIHPSTDPLIALREIGACRRIVTSSLHGMILADAFGIPRRVEYCKTMDRDGGMFKFKDYSASISMPFETGKMAEPVRVVVEDVKYAVFDAFRELAAVHK